MYSPPRRPRRVSRPERPTTRKCPRSGSRPSTAKLRTFFARKSATISELEKFYNGMAEAMHVGADFRSALDLVAPSAETPYFRGVIAALYEQKASAASIAALMRNFPGAFNNVAVAMIEQGETCRAAGGGVRQAGGHDPQPADDHRGDQGRASTTRASSACLLLVAMIVVNFLVLPMITKNFSCSTPSCRRRPRCCSTG